MKNNKLYHERIQLGMEISRIIERGIVLEESLTKEDKRALDTYQKQCPCIDISNIILRPWQQNALELCKIPTDREVIWIIGRRGNEGKSYLQSYIEAYYGSHRVVRLTLRMTHSNACHVFQKQSLSTAVIFLFNDARSIAGDTNDFEPYRILESVKDGMTTTSKYDNDNIKFKIPNTVMVFSNHNPDFRRLSTDRWKVYVITEKGIRIHEE